MAFRPPQVPMGLPCFENPWMQDVIYKAIAVKPQARASVLQKFYIFIGWGCPAQIGARNIRRPRAAPGKPHPARGGCLGGRVNQEGSGVSNKYPTDRTLLKYWGFLGSSSKYLRSRTTKLSTVRLVSLRE